MQRVDWRPLQVLGMATILLTGCADSGRSDAQAWMQAQQQSLPSAMLAPVPPVVDIPPANYQSKAMDPFLPERVSARVDTGGMAPRTDVIFPETSITGLSVTGYLSGDQRVTVAMVRSGALYRGVRVGDRLGQEAAVVKQIGAQGVLVAVDGAPERWLPINKPSP